MFVRSKEFLDLKHAPLRPLDLPWPRNYGCACIFAPTPSLVDFLLPRNVCPVKGPRGWHMQPRPQIFESYIPHLKPFLCTNFQTCICVLVGDCTCMNFQI